MLIEYSDVFAHDADGEIRRLRLGGTIGNYNAGAGQLLRSLCLRMLCWGNLSVIIDLDLWSLHVKIDSSM